MKSFFKKISLVLVLAMVVTMMPTNLRVASAADGPQMYSTLKFYLGGDETGKYSDEPRYAKTWNKDGYDVVGQFVSSNPEVAKVNSKGRVTPLAVGTTTITATFKSTTGGEDVVRECVVTVKKNAVEAGISEKSAEELAAGIKIGEPYQTKTYRTDADGVTSWKGTDVITSPARFTSSDETVFTVTKKGGYIKPVGIGTATLKVWAVQSESPIKDEDGNVVEYLPVTPVKEYTVNVVAPDPTVVAYDRAVLRAGNYELVADGTPGTLITFTLYSGPDMVDTETKNVQVRLETTYGTLAFTNVTLENGTATVLYTTPILTQEATARITAIIVSAEDTEAGNALINTQAAPIDIRLVPDTGSNTVVDENGATVLSSTVVTADRVTLYFNKPVKAEDFMHWYNSKWNVAPRPGSGDSYKFELKIDENIPQTQSSVNQYSVDFDQEDIINILQNTETSLTFVLKDGVKYNGLSGVFTDNSRYALDFKDKSKNGVVDSKSVIGYVTDAIIPAMLSVTQYQGSMTEILVTFSEPMPEFDASHVVIDGIPLKGSYAQDRWGAGPDIPGDKRATVTRLPGDENNFNTRNRYIIKLGLDANGDQIYFPAGRHSLTINKVGDYAYDTDSSNFISTQTLDFNIVENTTVPSYEVIVQSPEQYLVQFNCKVYNASSLNANDLKLQYSERGKNNWNNVKDWHGQDYDVVNLGEKDGKTQILVEVKYDWTMVLGTRNENYYNYDFRIRAEKDTIKNDANGKKNGELNINLDDEKMKTVDYTSPIFVGEVEEVDGGTKFAVTLDEPIQFTKNGSTYPTGISKAGNITPSSMQGPSGVPIITAQFVAKDNLSKTVDANIVDIDRQNYTLYIEVANNDKLEAGKEYTLYVRSVSDDIGNTSSTLVKEFRTMDGAPVTPTVFQIAGVWADANLQASDGIYRLDEVADDTGNNLDAIYVEFTKDFARSGGTKTVLTNANWSINGSPLPPGSYIIGSIVGDSRLTGVTIVLPHGTITDISATVVTLSRNVEDKDGKPLEGPNRVVTPYPYTLNLLGVGHNSALQNYGYLGQIGTFAAKDADNKIKFSVDNTNDGNVTVFTGAATPASGAALRVTITMDPDHGDSQEQVLVDGVLKNVIEKYILKLYGVKDGNNTELATVEITNRASLSDVTFNIGRDKLVDGDLPYTEFKVELQAKAISGCTDSVPNLSAGVTYTKVTVSVPAE